MMTTNEYIIENKKISVGVNTTGGCLSHFSFRLNNGDTFPILRPMDKTVVTEPLAGQASLFPLIPFVNRIRNNQFDWRNQHITLPHNHADPQFFLHGDGWLRSWHLEQKTPTTIQLLLPPTVNDQFPFVYQARQILTVTKQGLTLRMELINRGQYDFPFGAGYHPFFTVERGSKVQVSHSGMWLEDDQHLPTDFIETVPDTLNFNTLRTLPEDWVNNGYYSAAGLTARLIHTNGLTVFVSSPVPYIQLYKPTGLSSFFCIEPQTQFVDAHNDPHKTSLNILAPDEKMTLELTITIMEN